MAEKRRKKLVKKVNGAGGINTHQNLLECLELGIVGKASLALTKDPTRSQCQHDLNLAEVRDLMLSLLSDDAPPKFFNMRNKPFIRHVVFLHVADCDDESALKDTVAALNQQKEKAQSTDVGVDVGVGVAEPPAKATDAVAATTAATAASTAVPPAPTASACLAAVRISKSNDEISLLPHKLLSIELEVEGTSGSGAAMMIDGESSSLATLEDGRPVSQRYRAVLPYVVPEGILRTWNFPLPPISTSSGNSNNKCSSSDSNSNENEQLEPSSKRQRTDEEEKEQNQEQERAALTLDNVAATKITISPTISATTTTAAAFLASCSRVTVQIGNDILSDFIETQPLPLLALSTSLSCTVPGYTVLALDCEMVLTTAGDELARISAVDEFGSTVLDLWVQPAHPVLDYRTQWSGVTAENLKGVTTTLQDVQYKLLTQFLFDTTLLVGHSLENDLKCLKLVHRRCVDTSVLFPHPRGFPLRNKLRYLASEYLQLNIQQQGPPEGSASGNTLLIGHDSVEDAATAMKLVLLKVEKGASFGTHRNKKFADRNSNNSNIICIEHTSGGHQQYQRVPIVAASFQQRAAPVAFICHSAKESQEYLNHCMPQDCFRWFPGCTDDTTGGNNEKRVLKDVGVGYDCRTVGYDVVGADADAEVEALKLQQLAAFLTTQLSRSNNGGSNSIRNSNDAETETETEKETETEADIKHKAALRRTFVYMSVPYDGRAGLTRLLTGLRNTYNRHPLVPTFSDTPPVSTFQGNHNSSKISNNNSSNSSNSTVTTDVCDATGPTNSSSDSNSGSDHGDNVFSNTLVVISRQANLRPVINLANQKRVCLKAQHANGGQGTTLGWSRQKETELKELTKMNNCSGECAFWLF